MQAVYASYLPRWVSQQKRKIYIAVDRREPYPERRKFRCSNYECSKVLIDMFEEEGVYIAPGILIFNSKVQGLCGKLSFLSCTQDEINR
jgi:hypothetical protein